MGIPSPGLLLGSSQRTWVFHGTLRNPRSRVLLTHSLTHSLTHTHTHKLTHILHAWLGCICNCDQHPMLSCILTQVLMTPLLLHLQGDENDAQAAFKLWRRFAAISASCSQVQCSLDRNANRWERHAANCTPIRQTNASSNYLTNRAAGAQLVDRALW